MINKGWRLPALFLCATGGQKKSPAESARLKPIRITDGGGLNRMAVIIQITHRKSFVKRSLTNNSELWYFRIAEGALQEILKGISFAH